MATLATNPVILGVLSTEGNDYGFVYLEGSTAGSVEQNDMVCSISKFRQMVDDGDARPVGSTGYADLANGVGIYYESKKLADKADYEVNEFNAGYYGICLKGRSGGGCVFGGDSANEDDYNKEYIDSVYDAWDGTLTDNRIELL